jgi:hypothetical protein
MQLIVDARVWRHSSAAFSSSRGFRPHSAPTSGASAVGSPFIVRQQDANSAGEVVGAAVAPPPFKRAKEKPRFSRAFL